MPELKLSSGTSIRTFGRKSCLTCKMFVNGDECGSDFGTVSRYAAVTGMYPCQFLLHERDYPERPTPRGVTLLSLGDAIFFGSEDPIVIIGNKNVGT